MAEPRELYRDVDRIAADQRLAKRRQELVDAIVADRGECEVFSCASPDRTQAAIAYEQHSQLAVKAPSQQYQ